MIGSPDINQKPVANSFSFYSSCHKFWYAQFRIAPEGNVMFYINFAKSRLEKRVWYGQKNRQCHQCGKRQCSWLFCISYWKINWKLVHGTHIGLLWRFFLKLKLLPKNYPGISTRTTCLFVQISRFWQIASQILK